MDSRACKVCLAGKLTSSPFHTRADRFSEILGIVHTDLCGPMRTKSKGARYFLMVTDDCSRWCEVFFLRNKSNVTSKLIEYKRYAEKQTGQGLKAMQSDNGTEFFNETMNKFLKDLGIRRRLTTVYTPQQNGVAERKNCTLVESARCMLLQSTAILLEAMSAANYIRNKCVTKSLEKGTPYEYWIGRKPNIAHLKIWIKGIRS